MAGKMRLDELLVERGLAEDRKSAAGLILSGSVYVDGLRIDKAGALTPASSSIQVKTPQPFASRGGLKLEPVLEALSVNVDGLICMDLGASTGGFTDCLLQRGARKVYAFDVGRGLLDWKLRQDPRVIVDEGVNVRYLSPEMVDEPPRFATIDLSFISLQLILPRLKKFAPILVLALVKPQFEAPRGKVGRGGVIRDEQLREKIFAEFKQFASGLDFKVVAEMDSPLPGQKGNRERFVLLELQ